MHAAVRSLFGSGYSGYGSATPMRGKSLTCRKGSLSQAVYDQVGDP